MLVPLSVLIVEDNLDDSALVIRELSRGGWALTHERVDSAASMTAALASRTWDIIISDFSMPSFSGLEALALSRRHAVDVPFVLVSGNMGEETAVQAMKAGANDYLLKGNLQRLAPAVERELREAETRRKSRQTEFRLQQRDQQLAEAQRLALLSSWHLDFRTNEAVWSDELCRILDRRPLDVTTPIDDFVACIHPHDQARFNEPFRAADRGQFAEDYCIVHSDGSERYVHVRGDIFRGPDGKPLEASGMIQDITARKHAEQKLQRAHDELAIAKEAAEAANIAKDHFLAILSHELRTPLTPILALVSLWEHQSSLPTEIHGQLHIIHRNLLTEVRLIDDLLDVTAIIQGRIELHQEAVNINTLLLDALNPVQKDIDAKDLNVVVRLEATGHHVHGDPIRLQQIFTNLLANAAKFTPDGGTITIRTEDAADGRLRIEIADNGIGIEAEILPRLFNRFEQGERTITRRFGGLGLGLSIARSLVLMHHGTIHAASAGRNKGAAFTIELSAITTPAMDIPAPSFSDSAPALRRASRVLLVEDHPDTRHAMTRLLKIIGCSVISADSVRQAVQIADSQVFDLLISDVGLPDGSGTDVMRYIKSKYQIKGIAVSGFGQIEDLEKSRVAGFSAHLTKPVEFKTLQAAIENTLAGHASDILEHAAV